jgi:heat shock protein HslJ
MKNDTGRFGGAARHAAIVVFVTLAGCAGKDPGATAPVATPAPLQPPTKEQLLVATVTGPFAGPVTLSDGRYEGPTAEAGAQSHPTLVLMPSTVLFGDIDGTPPNEAVALLGASGGGSGEFTHVAAFAMRDGKAQSLGTAQVGDRVQVYRTWLERNRILMDVVEAAPGEPACCPTQLSRKAFGWQDGKLVMLESTPVSRLSVNLLTATDWMLVEMDGKPLVDGVMPPTALIQYGKITGFAGCNRYSGPLTESRPGAIKVGELVATKKACDGAADALESQFLVRLGKADAYTFQAGRLVVSGPSPDAQGARGSLVFAR